MNKLLIATYNILADCNTDFNLREGVNPIFLSREHRTPLIIKKISESNADIIALQEIDNIMLNDILTELGSIYLGHIELHAKGTRNYGNAFLYKKELKPVISAYHFNDQSKRAVVIMNIQEISICNVHLDFSANARQIEELIKTLPLNAIICGDFNAERNTRTIKICEKNNFKYKSPAWTAVSMDSYKTIDYIMIRGKISIDDLISKQIDKVLIPNEIEGSDHLFFMTSILF